MQENKKIDLFLAALNPYTQSNMVENIEKKITGKDFVIWGENNGYPNYLLDCYNNCSTLQSIINGTGDYVTGDDVICKAKGFEMTVNQKGDTIKDLVAKIVIDYITFGAFSLQVIRNMAGQVAEIYWVDVSKLRSDEKNEVFYYSEDWSKSYGRVKTLQYPKFGVNDSNPTSIFYFKNPLSRCTYGVPVYAAAMKNISIDMAITDFHNNEINNGFMSSKMISFCNGTPDESLKEEIERNLTEKFSGSSNAGRFVISFSQSRENAPEVVNLGTDDFDKRYVELEKRNTQQIFVAFRATPVLFGMVTESNGFATNEYRDSYKLFNKTVVQPIQKNIVDAFNKILGDDNAVEIKPFTIEFDEDNKTENVE